MAIIDPAEVSRLQAYLQNKFGHNGIALKMRGKANDSVEIIMNGEFIGTIYKDEEDGETSYDLNMVILEVDLPAAA